MLHQQLNNYDKICEKCGFPKFIGLKKKGDGLHKSMELP